MKWDVFVCFELFITLDLLEGLFVCFSVTDRDPGKSRQIFQGILNVSQFLRRSDISWKSHFLNMKCSS